ncbi:MAG TPA: nuclear transport factor 2 family protein [Jiangellaceae bacterium]|nr:nuclear transport factor 2 family protein [Jiangellaceae bacterium]
MEHDVNAWVEGYVRAWNSNDPEDIRGLFSEDARYFTEPYADPWLGRQAIVDGWLKHKDEPGQTSFEWNTLVVTPDVAVVEGRTEYHVEPPRTYRNLWQIRLDGEGRCAEFTEWWMKEPDPRNAGGPSAEG